MRLQLRNLMTTLVVAAMALMVGCKADDKEFAKPDNDNNGGTEVPEVEDGEGYLSVSNLRLFVDCESEDFNNDDYMVDDKTKADADDLKPVDDSYILVVRDKDQVVKYQKSIAETTTDIELPVGVYTLQVRSWDEESEVAEVGTVAHYASEQREFEIAKQQKSEIEKEIICELANIKVTLEMAIDLMDNFRPDADSTNKFNPDDNLEVTLDYGSAQKVFTRSDIKADDNAVYFKEQRTESGEINKLMKITLNGQYNTEAADKEPSYQKVTWEQELNDIKGGQYRIIAINYANYNEGQIHIEFKVYTWTYATEIGVSILTPTFITRVEEEILDPDDFVSDAFSPIPTLGGGLDIADIYEMDPSMFDEDKSSYSPEYSLVLTPQEGASIKSAVLRVASSTNASFKAAIQAAGFSSGVELWSAAPADQSKATADDTTTDDKEVDLTKLFKATESATSKVVTVDMLYEGAKALGGYYGLHKMKLTVVDSEGRESNTLLTINSTSLTFKWVGGDFSKRYDIWAEEESKPGEESLEVDLKLTSVTGFTMMKINMVSKALTDELLDVLSLKKEMDLTKPANADMAASLKGLGFPVGDDIIGQKSVDFNLTEFMPLLAILSDEGSGDETDFVITVGDESGSISKTLKLRRR